MFEHRQAKLDLFIFVLAIPVIHTLATVFTPYFSSGGINPGTVRAGIIGVFLLLFCVTRYEWNLPNSVIMLFLIYYLALVFTQSSTPATALYGYSRMFLWAVMFPVGYYFFRNLDALKRLNQVYVVVLMIFLMDLCLANIIGYGVSNYAEDTVYYGSSGVNITKTMAVILLMAPVILRLANGRNSVVVFSIVFSMSGVFVLLGLKRSALAALVLGFLIYLFLSPERGRALTVCGVLGVLVALAAPIYLEELLVRYEARGEAFGEITSGEIQEEKRFTSDVVPAVRMWWNGSLKHQLFGSEVFNPVAVTGGRNIHVDYARSLVESGLIGLSLFLLVHVVIAFEMYRYFFYVREFIICRELHAVFWALMAATFIMGYAGTLMGISLRALLFLYFGAIVGVLRGFVLAKVNEWQFEGERSEGECIEVDGGQTVEKG